MRKATNLRNAEDRPGFWQRFTVTEPDQHVWYYRELADALSEGRHGEWLRGDSS